MGIRKGHAVTNRARLKKPAGRLNLQEEWAQLPAQQRLELALRMSRPRPKPKPVEAQKEQQ